MERWLMIETEPWVNIEMEWWLKIEMEPGGAGDVSIEAPIGLFENLAIAAFARAIVIDVGDKGGDRLSIINKS